MPRIRSVLRPTRKSRNPGTAPLRRYAKPRNMDRLLAALYESFEESGTTWISVDVLLRKIEEQAQTLDDTLGKKFGPYCRSCLSALRRNAYIEYKLLDSSDDEVRITDSTKEMFENLKNAIPTFGDQSAGDIYRLKCDYLRSEVQPKSRRLPTRAELDRENVVLGQKNRELMEEHAELESQLHLLRQDLPDLTALPQHQSTQGQRDLEATEPNVEQLESGFTDSMYTDPVHASQERVSVQPRLSMAQMPVLVTQSLSRQPTMQTPVRLSAAECYPTPESPPRSSLGRQDSHLISPPASPSSRRSSPAYTMPGALAVESFSGENDGEGWSLANGGSMDIDDNDDDEQVATRPCTPESVGVENRGAIAFPFPEFAPIQTEVPSSNCAWCAIHRNQVDTTTTVSPAMPACQGCESKTKTIESNERVISELQGNLEDHKSLIDNLQDLILQKIKKIRELTSRP